MQGTGRTPGTLWRGQADRGRAIRRYGNRKLYEPAERRYVTLEDLAAMLARGESVTVVDQPSGEDITATVLAQVMLEGLKHGSARIPAQVLARLIRLGSGSVAGWAEAGEDLAGRARDEAERIVSNLVRSGRLTLEEALAVRGEIAESVGRLAHEAQAATWGRIQKALLRVEGEGAVGGALAGLRERLMSLETFLAETPATGKKPEPAKPRTRRKHAGRKPRGRRPHQQLGGTSPRKGA